MAFVQTAIWEVTNQRRALPATDQPIRRLFDLLLANGRDFYASRALSAMLAVLIQIVLIWLFLMSQARPVNRNYGQSAGADAITVLDLSNSVDPNSAGASASAPIQPSQALPPQTPTLTPQSLVDASVSPVTRPEWSVSKIELVRPSRTPLTPPATTAPLASAANGMSSGTGSTGNQFGGGAGGGGSGYDPNAGAAPLRRDTPPGAGFAQAPTLNPTISERIMGFLGLAPPAPPAQKFDLDSTALESARADAARRLKGARGSVTFAVRISPTGMVLDAVIKRTTLSRAAAMAVRAALLGRRLHLPRGQVSDGAIVELPTMTFS